MVNSGQGPDLSEAPRPGPRLGEMLLRVLRADGQSRTARTVELFGFYDLALGVLILLAPLFVARLFHLPALNPEAANYVRLVGLLVSGLGMLYIVSGRLNSWKFAFASLLDRPVVPLVMLVLWRRDILPGPLALAFSVSDFGGFLWTLSTWLKEMRVGRLPESPAARTAAAIFGFTSGVVRNARTFHPDGRVFTGTVQSLHPPDPALADAADRLVQGVVLMRIGMGLMKSGMPGSLAAHIPDAPSIATRFFSPSFPGEIRLTRRDEDDLDLLCTAGGDRLWKLVLNLATGGRGHNLQPFDYLRNTYYAETRYRVAAGPPDIWIRLVPQEILSSPEAPATDAAARERRLTEAVAQHRSLRIEAQRAGDRRAAFVPFAEIRFEQEIVIDQEALHFDPAAGRGFTPLGILTALRSAAYPASVAKRPATQVERTQREHERVGARLTRYLGSPPAPNLEDPASSWNGVANIPATRPGHPRLRLAALVIAAIVAIAMLYLALRLTRDKPVEYADDLMHYKYGSTGGERTMGIPYWFWVALPELFPEYLPDHQTGHGYKSFGMIYEDGKDPRFDLPVGISMRNVRGIDVVYLNCAVCHTGTVRDRPGAKPRVITGMPAQGMNLGAFEQFLTTIPLDQKFVPQRMLDQIDVMDGNSHRLIAKPDLLNRLIFRYYAVSLMREKMLMLRQRLGFIHAETWGPGRVDTFNAPKALMNFNMTHADPKEMMGNADFPSIWNQGPRQGMQLHWDGNNTSVDERNLSAAFGTGAYPPTLDAALVERTAHWLLTAKPAPYPYPVDAALAQKGAPIYASRCAGCHGTRDAPFRSSPEAEHGVGTVVPIASIATDRSRLDSYTYLVAANQGTLYAGYERDWGFKPPYPQRFSHFHKTQGYANSPLDGIWLRAPYLHNGSVPNLWELLQPSALRSKSFFRGNDVYDPQNVGFVSDVAEQDGTRFFPFNTSDRGNGNGGHEGPNYGTDLAQADKRALLEYLKTF